MSDEKIRRVGLEDRRALAAGANPPVGPLADQERAAGEFEVKLLRPLEILINGRGVRFERGVHFVSEECAAILLQQGRIMSNTRGPAAELLSQPIEENIETEGGEENE